MVKIGQNWPGAGLWGGPPPPLSIAGVIKGPKWGVPRPFVCPLLTAHRPAFRNLHLLCTYTEHCTPLIRALDQCRRDVCPVLKQRHLLTQWGARLSSYIQRCHKHYKAACNTALRLYTQAKHTAHVHARHTSVGDMPVSHTA